MEAANATSDPTDAPLLAINVPTSLIPVDEDEVAPSLPKTGGRLVGSPNIVVGVGKLSDPQDVEVTAIVTKLVD